MKLNDIRVGQQYIAQIPPRIDRCIAEQADHGEVVVTVLEVGVPYEVETYSASMVRGAGYTRTYESARDDGVRVQWEDQTRPWRFGAGTTRVYRGEGIVQGRRIREIRDWERS